MAADRLVSDLLFDVAADDGAAQADPAAASWALWFDVLREHMAAANGSHPLRWADVLAE